MDTTTYSFKYKETDTIPGEGELSEARHL
jgi:hypothetical protein